jgi:hypothetical protein
MSPSALEFELRELVAQPGCPICRLLRASEERYWSFLLYEGFQDPEVKADVRDSLGYCARHVGQLAARQDVFAFAVLARAAVEGALAALTDAGGLRRRSVPPPGRRCPACRMLASTERNALDALGVLLDRDRRFLELYGAADGLCLGHIALARAGSAVLRAQARARFDLLAVELARLIYSFDYRAEPAGRDLAGAWRRAFRALRDDPGPLGRD